MKKVLTGSALMLGFLAFGLVTPAQANFSHFNQFQPVYSSYAYHANTPRHFNAIKRTRRSLNSRSVNRFRQNQFRRQRLSKFVPRTSFGRKVTYDQWGSFKPRTTAFIGY